MSSTSNSKIACPVCFAALGDDDCPKNWVPCVLNPCSHLICLSCSQDLKISSCPTCRQEYESIMPLVHLVSVNAEAVEAARLYRIGADEKKASSILGFDPANLSIEEVVFIARREGADSVRNQFAVRQSEIASSAARDAIVQERLQFAAREAEIVSAARREGAEAVRREFQAREEERAKIEEKKREESTKKRLETRARNIREKKEAKERIASEIREISNSEYAPFVFCGLDDTSDSKIEVVLDEDGGGLDADGKKQRVN